MLDINNKIKIPIKEFRFSFARSSGPGGQNVNKLNTKVTLHWPLQENETLPEKVMDRLKKKYHRRINHEHELVIISQRFRDQGRNVADCMNKLRDLVLEVVPEPKKRKKTKPSASSNRKRLDQKKRQSKKKEMRKSIDD